VDAIDTLVIGISNPLADSRKAQKINQNEHSTYASRMLEATALLAQTPRLKVNYA
jgi:hypothetical protein